MPEESIDSGGNREDQYRKALQRAVRMLSRRQHGERELRDKLARGFEQPTVDRVIGRLTELGYIDDLSFAEEYARQRFERSPRSALAVRRELEGRGVSRSVAGQGVGRAMEERQLSDEQLAREAASRKYRQLGLDDPERARVRLFRFLASRGFTRADSFRALESVLGS